MNERIKRLWVEALRSGEYKQGKDRLVTESGSPDEPDAFCCLGVLTNLYVEETGDVRAWDDDPSVETSGWFLEPVVAKWAGLDNINPDANGECLSEWNDDRARFTTLANLIEKYL